MKVIVAMKKKKIKEMNMVKLMAIMKMMKMKVKMICIGVIVRLVSITPGHVKLD